MCDLQTYSPFTGNLCGIKSIVPLYRYTVSTVKKQFYKIVGTSKVSGPTQTVFEFGFDLNLLDTGCMLGKYENTDTKAETFSFK